MFARVTLSFSAMQRHAGLQRFVHRLDRIKRQLIEPHFAIASGSIVTIVFLGQPSSLSPCAQARPAEKSLWHGALQKLVNATDSQAASFWLLDGSGQSRLPSLSFINFDPQLIRKDLDGMAEHDPTVQYLARHPGQSIVHDGPFITEQEKDRHIYHHRYSETRFRLISQMSPAPGLHLNIHLHVIANWAGSGCELTNQADSSLGSRTLADAS
jgi:hypothetical protein